MYLKKNASLKFFLIDFLIILCVSIVNAQQAKLTPQLLDTLKYEGTYESSNGSIYDVAGYDRYYRHVTSFGTFKSYNIPFTLGDKKESNMPEYTLNKGYVFRIGGFYRKDQFGPDLVGELLAKNHVEYTDGPSKSTLESLMICKKYGIHHYFYAPESYDIIGSDENTDTVGSKASSASAPTSGSSRIIITSHELDLPFLNADRAKYIAPFKKEL